MSGLIDIQSCRAAGYSNFSHRSIIKQFSGCSIFKVFGLLDIQTFRVTPYSNFVGCSVFYLVGLVVIQSFRDDRYSHLSGRSIFKVFGLLDIQTFPGCRSIFKVFGLLDIQTFWLLDIHSFRAAWYSKFWGQPDSRRSSFCEVSRSALILEN